MSAKEHLVLADGGGKAIGCLEYEEYVKQELEDLRVKLDIETRALTLMGTIMWEAIKWGTQNPTAHAHVIADGMMARVQGLEWNPGE